MVYPRSTVHFAFSSMALYSGIGSGSLKPLVNAFDRLTYGSRLELLVHGLKVQVVHSSRQVRDTTKESYRWESARLE
jgi:hypothetical protein